MLSVLLAGIIVLLVVLTLARLTRDDTIVMPRSASAAAGAGTGTQSVEALIAAGRKIDAIKQLRAETGLGLKDAKEEVEARARQLG